MTKAELEALVAAGLCNEAGLTNDEDEDNEQQQQQQPYSNTNGYDDDMTRHDSAGLSDAVVPSSINMNFP